MRTKTDEELLNLGQLMMTLRESDVTYEQFVDMMGELTDSDIERFNGLEMAKAKWRAERAEHLDAMGDADGL